MLTRAFELATAAALAARGLEAGTIRTAGGWDIKCWRGGTPDGEPWLLLHGLGATAATYLPLLPQLQTDCSLLLPELSRLGGTRGPEPALAIPQATRALAELIEKLFPGRAVTVCGISLGGWIAVRLALARPDLVARLLLVVPGGYREQDWDRIGRMVRVETYRDSAAVRAALGTLEEADAFGDAELATLKMPVGLVWGAEDRLFLRAAGERMSRAIAGAHFMAIERAGHGVQWERPRAFLDAVRAFRHDCPLS